MLEKYEAHDIYEAKEPYSSRLSVINLYIEQLQVFKKLGIGKRTRFGTIVTDKLINTTKKRLAQLSSAYDHSITSAAKRWRLKRDERQSAGL